MIHRVRINRDSNIKPLYFQRKMVIDFDILEETITKYLDQGFAFGSIGQCLESTKYFHLSFDDGFKEHLECARILKDRYDLKYDNLTFSINTGNSILKSYSGMDIIYLLINKNQKEYLKKYFNLSSEIIEIKEIKNYILKLSPGELNEMSMRFERFHNFLYQLFLNTEEVRALSEMFQIASHGITHRDLTYHESDSKYEIKFSKNKIEEIINKEIEVFCYPEGKNNERIQTFCKEAGYKFALSIKNQKGNPLSIGRIMI